MLGFAIEFCKKLDKHACGTGNTHAKYAVECVFPKNNVKTNYVLLKLRKDFEVEQPFLLICCSAKFVLFTSVCVVAKFLFWSTGKFTFRKHCKIGIGIKACNFQFCFRFV